MERIKIFISSVQKEFLEERRALANYLGNDPLMSRFFCFFLFEDIPAGDRKADELYLEEVRKSDIYVGIFGNEYGFENHIGLSSTHLEYIEATDQKKHRMIFVKGQDDSARNPKMKHLISEVNNNLVRRRFNTTTELISLLYASLVQFLEEKKLLRNEPFDLAFCRNAFLSDIDEDKVRYFLKIVKRARSFPLPEDSDVKDILMHLNLLSDDRLTNAAILIFGKKPQHFLLSSEVKCAHFHGTTTTKPIPSYQVFKGTLFELIDKAVDFVMSKINLWIGDRSESNQVPLRYEIPHEVVIEAIVNAVAHRNYTSNGSVQVMLFADRLEVWNPGELPSNLTAEKLKEIHGSFPVNPLLAEPLYLTKYIERMGTGIQDMIERCQKHGIPEPEFSVSDGVRIIIKRSFANNAVSKQSGPESRPESRPESLENVVLNLLKEKSLSKAEIAAQLGHKSISRGLKNVIIRLLLERRIEQTIPEKPNSRLQKYRIKKTQN
jgi:predicted HTH transcriptional regulator